MAGSAERAINMALRVIGIGEVERDFKRVGQAGEQSFEKVEQAANGADRAVSDYTARLKRAVDAAKQAFDRTPGVADARAQDPGGYLQARNAAILERVEVEKRRIQDGLPDLTTGVDAAGSSLARLAAYGAAAGAAMLLVKEAVFASAEAYMEHERALDAFQAELALTGNQSDATAAQIEDMAERIVAATLQTEEAALQGAAALAGVSGLHVRSFEEALAASAAFADRYGKELPEIIESVTAPVLQALADRDMAALIKATEDLDAAWANQIVQLAAAGRAVEAQQALISGLRERAGDGPDGLTTATNKLGDSWDRLKVSLGEDIAGPAAAGLNLLAGSLDWIGRKAQEAKINWLDFLGVTRLPIIGPMLTPFSGPRGGGESAPARTPGGVTSGLSALQQSAANWSARAERQRLEALYGEKPKTRSGRARSGGSGKSDADRESERLQREAEQARAAADRVRESNQDVIESYRLRAAEAEEKIGLEGAALAAVERAHAVEAIARRISTDLIDKEVEARRAEAAAKRESFDENAAIADATALVAGQAREVRELAESWMDAEEQLDAFNRRQAEARTLIEGLRTPVDVLNGEVEKAIELLRAGAIEADDFNRRMDQLAEGFADAAYAADEGAQAWKGFGQDVGRTLADIALNGGNARDILLELIRLPLERLLEQNFVNPVADWIDSQTGNNRADNLANARAGLPDAQRVLGASVQLIDPAAQQAALSLGNVGTTGMAAAQGLQAVAFAAGNPIDDLAMQTELAAGAMGELVPMTGQLGNTMMQVISQLTSGSGGGGGGFLSTVLQFGMGIAQGAMGAGEGGAMPTGGWGMPGLYASGTDRVPTGRPFWVGENGRELMEKDSGGNLRVYSNQEAHRLAEGGRAPVVIQQTINIPERADPRRTASGLARSTQSALARSAAKGLAVGPRFGRG